VCVCGVHACMCAYVCRCGLTLVLLHSLAAQYIALYDYKPQSDDDLALQENDVIVLLEKSDNEEWCRGQVGERTGWFPTEYARLADESNEAGDNEGKKTMPEGLLHCTYNIMALHVGELLIFSQKIVIVLLGFLILKRGMLYFLFYLYR